MPVHEAALSYNDRKVKDILQSTVADHSLRIMTSVMVSSFFMFLSLFFGTTELSEYAIRDSLSLDRAETFLDITCASYGPSKGRWIFLKLMFLLLVTIHLWD